MNEENVMIPWGYQTSYRSVAYARLRLMEHYHPEYVDRLCAWLVYKKGVIGIGGTWRADGTQPDKPGFAPEGKSFHQNQKYSDGFIGATAVDLVVPRPGNTHSSGHVPWSLVPKPGSVEAQTWGVHCNISSESWHMQPVEIRGHTTWLKAGSPAPVADYPFPGRFDNKEIKVTDFTFKKNRVLDTRELGGRTTAGQVIVLSAPEGAKAVKFNLTVTETTQAGFISAYPYGTFRPTTSDLNWGGPGVTICNQIDVPVNSGKFSLYVLNPAHVIVDQVGYWT